MAINKKLIHFKTKANFEAEYNNGNILDTSICFIKDTKEIWTHGLFYNRDEVDLSLFVSKEELEEINDKISSIEDDIRLTIEYNFVDLGLPSGTLWCDRNIGAKNPKDSGLYFAWGETRGYTSELVISGFRKFLYDEYKYGLYIFRLTKYNNELYAAPGILPDNKTTLELSDDAAAANLLGTYIPSPEQSKELFTYTDKMLVFSDGSETEYEGDDFYFESPLDNQDDSVKLVGMKFINRTNSNKFIFIPAAGYAFDSKIIHSGDGSYLWSNSLYETLPWTTYTCGFYNNLEDKNLEDYESTVAKNITPGLGNKRSENVYTHMIRLDNEMIFKPSDILVFPDYIGYDLRTLPSTDPLPLIVYVVDYISSGGLEVMVINGDVNSPDLIPEMPPINKGARVLKIGYTTFRHDFRFYGYLVRAVSDSIPNSTTIKEYNFYTKELTETLVNGVSADTSNMATKDELKYVSNSLNNKVDKVTGKQLSTEDFTTLLKQKLEGLDIDNLDDKIEGLKGRLDTLLDSENANNVIDTFKELENFLKGITDTKTLTGLLQEMKNEILSDSESKCQPTRHRISRLIYFT